MIKPDLSKWEYKEELEGLLVFAQALEEMLFHHTIDTYKATALNVHTNILELRYLVNQLRHNRIRLRTIEPVIGELGSKLKQDLVIRPKYNSVFSYYFQRIEQLKAKPQELFVLLEALLSEIDNFYWKELLLNIEEKISEPKQKSDIIGLANSFITEAELQGFSRSYIYYKTLGFFFKPEVQPSKIQSGEQIKEFLVSFTPHKYNWQIVFRGAESFGDLAKYTDAFSDQAIRLAISSEIPADIPAELRANVSLSEGRASHPLYISISVSEKVGIQEPISARDIAKTSIDTLSDVCSFVTHQEQANISEDAFVINKQTGENNTLQPSPNPMKCGIQRRSVDNTKEEIGLFISIINTNHFDPPSSRLIIKSLEFHRAALEAKTSENQLLDLWAALEGFLPVPSEEEARVTHYINTLIPSLTLTYPEKIIHYLAESIYHGGGKCRGIVERTDIEGDFFEKVAAIVICNDLLDKRDLLYGELDEHVILRYRIYEVHESFKSKKNIKNTILWHRQRMTWHIQRIYTTRNQIIHNANSLPYLRTLVENLHSYFDILIETTSAVALHSANRISISSALGLLAIHEQGYLRNLDGDDEVCTLTNYKDLVFGVENPINPFKGISFYN